MNRVIIFFRIKDTDFRLVTGHSTGRNEVEKSEPDRLGIPTWHSLGYNVSGQPTAEYLLQKALLRAFSNKSHERAHDARELVDTSLCVVNSGGDIEITLLSKDLEDMKIVR